MMLRVTDEELDMMRSALAESVRSVRDNERIYCSGASRSAIELCRKRLCLEALLDHLDQQRASMVNAA